MLGLRSRMEQIADEVWPGMRPFNVGLYKSYEQILTSTNTKFTTDPRVIVFRQLVSNSNITDKEFLDATCDIYIYRIFSKKSAHPAGFNAPVSGTIPPTIDKMP